MSEMIILCLSGYVLATLFAVLLAAQSRISRVAQKNCKEAIKLNDDLLETCRKHGENFHQLKSTLEDWKRMYFDLKAENEL